MNFSSDDIPAKVTEVVMAALRRADVLKPDEPDYPTHYNRAFSSVYEALRGQQEVAQAAAAASAGIPSRKSYDTAAIKNLSYLDRKGLVKTTAMAR